MAHAGSRLNAVRVSCVGELYYNTHYFTAFGKRHTYIVCVLLFYRGEGGQFHPVTEI